MGEFLVAPLVIFVIALIMCALFAAGKFSKARRDAETLPDEPYARREEELRRMRADHEAARPEHVTHPARRP